RHRDDGLRQDQPGEILSRQHGAQGADRVPFPQPPRRRAGHRHAALDWAAASQPGPRCAGAFSFMTNEFLIAPRWIVPVEPAGLVLEGHAVSVRAGRIEAILPPGAPLPSAPRIELPEHVLIPGLVNAHTHAAMTL